MCVHEVMIQEKALPSGGKLCPAVIADQTKEIIEDVAVTAATAATTDQATGASTPGSS